jgi:translocation and assembly module TamB
MSRRARRVAIGALVGVLALASLLGATLYWASRSETVLRWAIAQAAQRVPGELTVTGVRGSMTEPVAIEAVRYSQDGNVVEARGIELDWSPWELLARERLHVGRLHLQSLVVTLPPGKADGTTRLPEQIGLPIAVEVDELSLAKLEVRSPETAMFEAMDVRLAFTGGRTEHRLDVKHIGTQWGEAQASLTAGTSKPFPLSGQASYRGEPLAGWPASANARWTGDLSKLAVSSDVRIRDLPIALSAQIAPLAQLPIETMTLQAQGVDPQRFAAAAPQAALALAYEARGIAGPGLQGKLALRNAQPGTLDQGRLPMTALQSQLTITPAGLQFTQGSAELASAGHADIEARVSRDGVEATVSTARLDLRGLHGTLRRTHLAGKVTASVDAQQRRYRGTLSQDDLRLTFDAQQEGDLLHVQSARLAAGSATLAASGQIDLAGANAFAMRGALTRFDPAAFGDFPAARISGTFDAAGDIKPQWHAAVKYQLGRSTFRNQPLSGTGRLTIAPGAVSDVDARLGLGSNRVQLQGAFGRERDVLKFVLDAPALQAISPSWSGQAQARGSISGTPTRLGVELDGNARALAIPGGVRIDALQMRGKLRGERGDVVEAVAHARGVHVGEQVLELIDVQASGSETDHRIELHLTRPGMQTDAAAEGRWNAAARSWNGRVTRLDNRGDYPLHLVGPVPARLAPEMLELGAARIELSGGRVDVGELRYAHGEITANGAFTGLSAATLLAWAKVGAPVQTSLKLGGRWEIATRQHVDGHIEVRREGGDVAVTVDDQQLALDVRELALTIDVRRDEVSAQLQAAGSRLGSIGAKLQTRLSQRDGRWGVASSAPLSYAANAQLSSLQPLVALFNRSTIVEGELTAQLEGSGTVGQPNPRGQAQARGLRIEQVENGLFLHDGALRASFDDQGLAIDDFSIVAGTGRLHARGRANARARGLDARLDWQADQLAAVQRPDLFLSLSGAGNVTYANNRGALNGDLRVDRGRVELKSGTAPTLGSDVEVVGQKRDGGAKARVMESAVDLHLDLGPDFKLTGQGLDARAEGKLHITSPGNAPLTARGEITIARGTYEAYGRKLDIDKGTLYFTGPLDNPGLNIRAMRKNQQVEAGVQITGTARAPVVALVSNPEVSDPEKLSWLLLGRKVDANNRTDAQALQSSAALLLADVGTSPLQKRIARGLGLDELGFSAADSTTTGTGTTGGSGGVVTLGKRISDRIYVLFEGGLGTAASVIKVNYQISRRWSLRTESGRIDAVDVFYSFSWD